MRLKNTSVSDAILAERRADLLSPHLLQAGKKPSFITSVFALLMMLTFLCLAMGKYCLLGLIIHRETVWHKEATRPSVISCMGKGPGKERMSVFV